MRFGKTYLKTEVEMDSPSIIFKRGCRNNMFAWSTFALDFRNNLCNISTPYGYNGLEDSIFEDPEGLFDEGQSVDWEDYIKSTLNENLYDVMDSSPPEMF